MIWARPYRGQPLRAPEGRGLMRSALASFMLHALFIAVALFFGWRSQGPIVSADVPFVELSLEGVAAGQGMEGGQGAYVGRARNAGPVALGKLPGTSFKVGMSRRKLEVETREPTGEPEKAIDREFKEGAGKREDIPLSAFRPVSVGLTGSIGKGREKESLELAIYKAQVLAVIKGNWAYAGGLEKGLTAQVVFQVTREGRLLEMNLARSSGNPLFDASVTKAVRASEPLPPFPAIFNRDTETIVVEFRSEERG